jgi:hypothetical protein
MRFGRCIISMTETHPACHPDFQTMPRMFSALHGARPGGLNVIEVKQTREHQQEGTLGAHEPMILFSAFGLRKIHMAILGLPGLSSFEICSVRY